MPDVELSTRRGSSRSPKKVSKTAPASDSNESTSIGLIAGASLAGVGLVAAIGARFLFKKRSRPASKQPSTIRSERRKLPPRRPRSTTSGTSSLHHSPLSSPVKAARPAAAPFLPPRKTPVRQSKAHDRTNPDTPSIPEDESAAPPREDTFPAFEQTDQMPSASATAAALDSTKEAVKADDVPTVVEAAENLEGIVDDQIAETKEEAVEALVGMIAAVNDAKEANEEAEAVFEHHNEVQAMPDVAEKAEDEPVNIGAAEPAAEIAEIAAVTGAVQLTDDVPPAPPENVGQGENGEEEEAEGHDGDSPALEEDANGFEPDDQFETIDDIPHPELKFDGAPESTEPLNSFEEKIRDASVHAHKLLKENHGKLAQAVKEQQAALDMAILEGGGVVRPSLVAACAFALADMLIAQNKINETKVALATAHAAAKHTGQGQGPVIRALMNYAYVLRGSGKPRSARATYARVLDLSKLEHGPVHPAVEQVKYEYTSFLAKSGHEDEAIQFLLQSAEGLIAESERLGKFAESSDAATGNASEQDPGKEPASDPTDPGSGLEHIAAEAEAAADAQKDESSSLTPENQAQHFAMRNLINAAGLLDTAGNHEAAEGALAKALEIAIGVHGENSVPHMNALYALGMHFRGRGALQEAINAHETVLTIMDETIETYEPELLQNRISVLRDAAILYDEIGDPATGVDYATGALVNAQTLAKIMATSPGAPKGLATTMLEPYWLLLATLKAKSGDAEGAAEARREALRGKLNMGLAARGGRGTGASQRTGALKRNTGSGATRAGGRRV